MSRYKRTTILVLALACGSCDDAPRQARPERPSASPMVMVQPEQASSPSGEYAPRGKSIGTSEDTTLTEIRPALDVSDRCDRLLLQDTPSGPQLTKARPAWLRNGKTRWTYQKRLRELVRLVAAEMGADDLAAEMIWRKAIYESSGNPGNVHIRSRDLEANRRAANKGRKLATKRWRRAKVPVYAKRRGRARKIGTHDAWALGRGLYGMVTGLHMHRWSPDAPPWSLCDPVIATVVMIWAMRAGLEECHGSTLRDAYRRFSSGKCAVREARLERRFDRLARGKVRGLRLEPFDPDAPAVLGERWPEATTDRAELLAVLRNSAIDAGLAH